MSNQYQDELRAYRAYIEAKTPQERSVLWTEYAKIHAARASEFVRQIEARMGLL